MTDKNKYYLKNDLIWQPSYLKLVDECNQDVNKSLLKIILKKLFSWVDTALDAPAYSSLRNGQKNVFILGVIEYRIDYINKSYQVIIKYEEPSGDKYSYAVATVTEFFTRPYWLQLALPALSAKTNAVLSKNKILTNKILNEVAITAYKDKRFIRLKESWLPRHVLPISEIQAIIKKLDIPKLIDSNDLNLIWSNLECYQQLIREKCLFIKAYHYAATLHYIEMRKINNHVGRLEGLPLSKQDSFFDLKLFKHKIKSIINLKAWRYLQKNGDDIFTYIWVRQSENINKAYTAYEYLKFLNRCKFPPPPQHPYLCVLFDMQGESWNIAYYSILWNSVWCEALVIGLHHFKKRGAVFKYQLNEFLNVMYWSLDQDITLDKNQLKQGWKYLVKKANAWHVLRQKLIKNEGKIWKKSAHNITIDGMRFNELNSHQSMYQAGLTMRNCLASDQYDYQPEHYRLFSMFKVNSQRYKPKPIGIVKLEWINEEWRFGEVLGFANKRLTPKDENIAKSFALMFKKICTINNIDYRQINENKKNQPITAIPEGAGFEDRVEFFCG